MTKGMVALVSVALNMACLGRSYGACDHLPPYTNAGLSRQAYLPCAAEMVSLLDQARAELEKAMAGDRQAFGKAGNLLRQVEMRRGRAGGNQKLLSRWNDEALQDLNVDIFNAYSLYHSVWLINSYYGGGRIAELREKSRPDVDNGTESLDAAKQLIDRLR